MKVSMMESEREKGNAAADLISQFMDAGFVKQGNDGSFTVPGANPKTPKPLSLEIQIE